MAEGIGNVDLPSGYPLELFEGTVDHKYLCQDCKNVLREPIQTYCGHRYCSTCLTKRINSPQSDCQACFEEDEPDVKLSTEESFPDKAILKEIGRLKSSCINEGCSWKGKFLDYLVKHKLDCQYLPIVCKCSESVPKLQLSEHEKKHCKLRNVVCLHCQNEILLLEREQHELTCPRFPIPCQNCGTLVPRDAIQQHQDSETGDCSHLICPYGCQEPVQKTQAADHNSKYQDTHFLYVVGELKTIKEGRQSDQVRIHSIETRVDRCIADVQKHTPAAAAAKPEGEQVTGATASTSSPRFKRVEQKVNALETVVKMNQDLVDVLSKETARNTDSLNSVTHLECEQTITQMQDKILTLERDLLLKDIKLKDQERQIKEMQARSYDGTLIWRIPEFSRKFEEARNGRFKTIYSPDFYTSVYGYKLCVKMYPYGDGPGKGTHVSLFFVIKKGDYDQILSWPFTPNMVVYQMFDQSDRRKEHHIDAFRPDPRSSSFQCPTNSMNPGFGCPEFITHTKLFDQRRQFIKNDILYLKVFIKERRNDTNSATN